MPRNRKLFIHNTLIAVSFRTEEGLPLVPTPYMRVILESILVRALARYNIILSHGIVMSNHVHLLLIVQEPTAVPEFVGYLKRESAHAINRLLGRRQRTIWHEGYDSPVILDPEKALEFITYLYTNPQRADLVKSIGDYPNLSTWRLLANGKGKTAFTKPTIKRDQIHQLSKRTLSLQDMEAVASVLLDTTSEEESAFIDPNAWINCFAEAIKKGASHYNARIIEAVCSIENKLNQQRTCRILGCHALKLQSMRMNYSPKKYGKMTICLSSSTERRVEYLSFYRNHCDAIKSCFCKTSIAWLKTLPPGLFAPGGISFGSLIPSTTPTFQPV